MGSRLGGQFILIKLALQTSHLGSIRSSPIGTDDSLILRRGTNQAITVVPLSNDCQVSARATVRVRCVVLSKSSTPSPFCRYRSNFSPLRETSWSRPDRFDRLQSCMFTPFVVGLLTPLSKSNAPASRTATCDLMWDRYYCRPARSEQHTTWQGICNSPLTLPFECRSAGMRRGRRMFNICIHANCTT
jgi:hypothetical protein